VAFVLGTTEGGTGRHVAMLARGCAAAGLGVGVFGPAPTMAVPGLGPAGGGAAAPVRFGVVPISDRPRPARDAVAIRRLRRLLVAMAPGVVHAHGLRAGALAALSLRPLPGARWPGGRPPALAVTVHNAPPSAAATAAVYRLLERLVARRADVVLCVSSDLEERMRRLGARRVGRAIVPAPPAAAADQAGAESAGLPGSGPSGAGTRLSAPGLSAAGRPVVLTAGRLAPQKGLETLIAAAARWRDRRPAPLTVIAGTGPLADQLAGQARDLAADVTFLGWRDDVTALLAAADLFVLPSRWEGQPLVLQEALRAGRPVVASDVGGVRDLTGDTAAVLVPPGDPAALAAAVLRVLDDPGLASGLGAAAAARAATLPTEADAIAAAMAFYEELAAGR
jgi:glycosyltransferase involved in cell wall biosynthesis